MEHTSRIELTLASPIGIGVFGASVLVAAIAGAPHPEIRPLVVFVVAFPILWTAFATALSYATVHALRPVAVELPSRTHAMDSFRLALTLAHTGRGFPAIGVLTNAGFGSNDVVLEVGPSTEIAILQPRRTATSSWHVTAKQRGLLLVGPFRATVELPGSAIRATAVFDTAYPVIVLPAVYHLQPFADALLAGRHVAGGRFQTVPAAIEEYVGAREYRPGDAPKLIHRVLSLRTSDPSAFYIREFKDPSRDDVSVVLDTAPPTLGDDARYRYRLEKAICFVSALCRTFAARRLTVRFVCQRAGREPLALRVRPLDADLDRLERELARVDLAGNRTTLSQVLLTEVRRHGTAVVFVTLHSREQAEWQRLGVVTLTPDHVPAFTREVVAP